MVRAHPCGPTTAYLSADRAMPLPEEHTSSGLHPAYRTAVLLFQAVQPADTPSPATYLQGGAAALLLQAATCLDAAITSSLP